MVGLQSRQGAEKEDSVQKAKAVAVALAAVAITFTVCAYVTADATREVRLVEGGTVRTLTTQASTVAEFLREAQVKLDEHSLIIPDLNTPLVYNTEVKVTTKTDTLPESQQNTDTVHSTEQPKPAQLQISTASVPKPALKTISRKSGKASVRANFVRVKALRQSNTPLSRSGYGARKVLYMRATGYAPYTCGGSRSGRTATGIHAGVGVVAVDPRVIPLGTKLYIEGYGYAVAADTGGAIKGNRIDLGHDTHSQAMRTGRRTVKVHVLN